MQNTWDKIKVQEKYKYSVRYDVQSKKLKRKETGIKVEYKVPGLLLQA